MNDKNYFTREMDDARKSAENKDQILKLLHDVDYSYRNEVAKRFEISPFIVDDLATEMAKSGLISKQKFDTPNFNFQFSITAKGKDFINSGGFIELWRDNCDRQILQLRKADEAEQAAKQSEAVKLTIEQDKLSVSKAALASSQKQTTIAKRQLTIAIVLGAFAIVGYIKEMIESRNAISRIEPIEKKVQILDEANIFNRMDSIENQLLALKRDSTLE